MTQSGHRPPGLDASRATEAAALSGGPNPDFGDRCGEKGAGTATLWRPL